MSARPVFINGRFLGKKITGTQRFAHEIVTALDTLLAVRGGDLQVTIVAPQGTPAPQGLSRIGFKTAGRLQGHAWEQIELPRAARGGVLASLCNAGPVLHRWQLVVIHDATVYRMPENYSFAYGALHRALGRILARRCAIATVSEFSRRELAEIFGARVANMPVLPNGYEHALRHEPDMDVIDRLGLRGRPFFFFVGSPAPNKNLARAVEAFASLNRPDVAFVIAGAAQANVFGGAALGKPENVLVSGRLADGEIAALYKNAAALVFPSLYEGFGIPPLEAMALGCPVLASRIPPVEEVCGDAALYFDPRDVGDIADRMRLCLADESVRAAARTKGKARLSSFGWRIGAQRLLDWIEARG